MGRWRWIPFFVLVWVAVWAPFWLWGDRGGMARPYDSGRPGAGRSPTPLHATEAVSHGRFVVESSVADLDERVLVVTDREGRPIEGAWLVSIEGGRRCLREEDLASAPRTDAAGRLRLPAEAPGTRVGGQVVARSFLPHRLSASQLSDPVPRVTLERGSTLRVVCRDLAGGPLADVSMWVSRASLPQVPCGASELPAPLGPAPVRFGRSGADGVLQVDGLEPGTYLFRLDHPTHVFLRGVSPTALVVPGPEVEWTFGEVLVGVYRLNYGSLLEYSTRVEAGIMTPSISAATQRVKRELEVAYPGTLIAATVRTKAAPIRPAGLSCLTLEHGLFDLEAPMWPLAAGVTVQELAVPPPPPESPCQPCTFRIRDELGRSVPLDDVAIQIDPSHRFGLSAELRPDTVMVLPAGEHRVRTWNRWLMGRIEPTTVQVPGDATLFLQGAYQRCEIQVLDETGSPLSSFRGSISASGQQQSVVYSGDRPYRPWLPIGPAVISLSAAGYAEQEARVEIVRDDSFADQTLTVQLRAPMGL